MGQPGGGDSGGHGLHGALGVVHGQWTMEHYIKKFVLLKKIFLIKKRSKMQIYVDTTIIGKQKKAQKKKYPKVSANLSVVLLW